MPASNATGDLRAQNPASHLDTSLGPPRGPRWNGTRPDITPARAAAIREKRAYERALAEGVFDRAADGNAFLRACGDARPLFLAAHVPVLAELHARSLRLFAALLLVHKRGHEGALLTHGEIADALGTSVSSARRAMVALLERGYAYVVAPAFEVHGAASSRRGNVYAVPAAVLESVERVRLLLKSEQASGTAPSKEPERSESSHRPPTRSGVAAAETANAPCATTACAQPEPASPVVVSASPTVDCRTVAADASSVPSLPATRQAETRSASLKAPDGEGVDELLDGLDERWRETAALAAAGDPFARELLVGAQRERRKRELALRGHVDFGDYVRRREAEARDRDGGGDAPS